MILALLLAQAAAPPAAPLGPPAQPPATLVAEPVAVAIAGFDADGDARVTRAELEAGVRRSFAAIDTAHAGTLGYIGFADWAERCLGNRSALPSPFETDSDGGQPDQPGRAGGEVSGGVRAARRRQGRRPDSRRVADHPRRCGAVAGRRAKKKKK